MKTKDWILAVLFAGGSLAFGSLGTIFTAPAIPTWYAELAKPSFNPPNWIFAPVWTSLFILIGIAAYLVWRKGWDKPAVRLALTIFAVQFILNVAWSFLFFGLKNLFLSLVEIVILWLAIAATVWTFRNIDKRAAILLLPYLAWVTFATFLTYSVWKLN